MECYDSAQVIRLDSVIDRFGNAMTLQYNDYASLRGRPTLERIDFPGWSSQCRYIEFIYNPFVNNVGEISVGNDVDGYYEIFTTGFTFAAFDNSNDHRAMVTRIMGLNNDTLGAFQYQDYNRTETNLAYSPSSTFTVKFDNGHLKRMSKFTNKNGGEKIYTYKGSITSSMDMLVSDGQYGIHSSDFYGQGRDAFFENMIEKVEYKQGTDTYKKIEYSYPFSDNGTSFAEEPVDASDDYRTEQFTINLTTDTIETPSKIGTKYYYKNYKIFNLAQNLMENYDFPGETKLLKEEHVKGEPESLIKTVEYFANIEGPVGTYSTYGGSFLDTLIKETINGAVKESEYKYEFYSDYPFTGATYKNPIKKITTIDPFDNKSVVEYEKMDGISKHYNDGRYILGVSTYKETPFFNLNLPKYEETYDNADNLTAKTNYSYIWGNDTDSGYIGQLVSTKIIDPSNGNIFKEFQNEFYKKDTVGEWMYVQAGEHKPGTEGNLKKTIDPTGNEKFFYYNPISFSESSLLGNRDEIDYFGEYYDTTDAMGQLPRVAYYKAYENGTITVSNSLWHDRRMPTRTDAFVSPGYSLTEYNLYTASGNLLNNINSNRYLSCFSYDALNRITHAVAPHDLAPFVQDTIIDTVIETVAIDTLTNLIGSYDYVADHFYYRNMTEPTPGDASYFFNIRTEEEYEDIQQENLPLIGFPTGLFKEFVSIDSASLILYPYQLHRLTNSDTSISNVKMIVRAADSFSVSGPLVINPNSSYQYQLALPHEQPVQVCSTSVYQENEFDIKDLLTLHMITQGKQFAGVQLDLTYSGGVPPDYSEYILYLGQNIDNSNCIAFNTWKADYAPRIKVYGKRRKITTYIKNELSNANYNFEYADDSNKVRTLTKLSVGNYKKNETIFDGFYRPIQNKMYTGATSFNSTTTEYNYLDKPSKTTDGRGIETKFSYDEFGNVKKTENPADTSASLMTSTFQNGLTYHWGSVSGIVNKQVFEDEVGNKFIKFFDMVGNLRREVKFVDAGTPSSPVTDSLITDYRYDSLYRVTNVKTPANKIISYKYDAFGRQKERTTVDAGTENFRYDKSDNLRFSMDAVQSGPNDFTFRGYDGINRLLYIGIGNLTFESTRYDWTDLNPDTSYSFENYSTDSIRFLTVNVYDTLSTSVASGLFSPPGDYYSVKNNTKGKLVATAYKTRTSETKWNFKYYRYDGKGRMIKMWNVLNGLGTKVFDYIFNSSDQPAYMTYQYGDSTGFKKFRYDYDDAGRLSDVKLYDPQNPAGDTSDAVGQYSTFASYKYNENSMIDTVKYNNGGYLFENIYNNRNWLYQINDHTPDKFNEELEYEKNGNVKHQTLGGTYSDNMGTTGDLSFTYTYDRSNRLIGVDQASGDEWDMQNTFDKDGNLTAMTRNDSKGNLEDNFDYAYYSGTNKLSHVTGSSAQFTYDANGNVLTDQLSDIFDMKYDHRNLMTEYKYVYSENYNAVTRMWYDDAGNRIRKISVLNFVGGGGGTDPDWDSLETFPPYDDQAQPPAGEGGGDNWQTLADEWYVRDVAGNEVALYNSTDLKQWNVGKEGKIDADQKKYFFIKDHLGTVRAVIDTAYNVVEANDVDIWGYRLMDREYNSSVTDNDYLFTGKERDNEKSDYDYFGARYFNSRIGRWCGVDMLNDKNVSHSPFQYGKLNPLIRIDLDGKDDIYVFTGFDENDPGNSNKIDESDYSPDSPVGALSLLYNLSEYIKDTDKSGEITLEGYDGSAGFNTGDIVDHIIENLSGKNEKIILYGYSMGGYNAIRIANLLAEKVENPIYLFTVDAYFPIELAAAFSRPEDLMPFVISSKIKSNINFFELIDEIHGSPNQEEFEGAKNITNFGPYECLHLEIDEVTQSTTMRLIKSVIKAKNAQYEEIN